VDDGHRHSHRFYRKYANFDAVSIHPQDEHGPNLQRNIIFEFIFKKHHSKFLDFRPVLANGIDCREKPKWRNSFPWPNSSQLMD
jgi:hypothetical protein